MEVRLTQIGGDRALEALVIALKNSDSSTRRAAVEALGQMGGERIVEPLINALKDGEGRVSEAAAAALGRIGDVRAVEGLINALKHWYRNERRAPAEALGRIGDARAVEPLVAALLSRQEYSGDAVRPCAAEALGRIGDARAVEPLIRAFEYYPDVELLAASASALAMIGDDRAVRPLVLALRDWRRKEAAANALGKLGWQPTSDEVGAIYLIVTRNWDKCTELGSVAIEPLIATFGRKDSVSMGAVQALGKIGEPAVQRLMVEFTGEEYQRSGISVGDLFVRPAIEALVNVGVPAVEPLISALKDGIGRRREDAADALGRIGDLRAVGPLVNALSDRDWSVRVSAAGALDKLLWRPSMDENGAAYYIVKRAWEKCVEIGAASLGAVAAVLENCPPEVEREQVSALARIGGTIAIEQIIAHLDHGDAVAAAAEAVRSEAEAARRGLGVQGKGAAAPLPLHPRCRRKDHGPLQATADPD